MKVLRLSVLCTGCLYPLKIFLVLISLRGRVDSRVMVRPEGLHERKLVMKSLGIELAIFRLVAYCLNELSHRVPPDLYVEKLISTCA